MAQKLVYGVGYNSKRKHKTHANGKITVSCRRWRSMFDRCYGASYQEKFPSYLGCTVADEWHDYQDFADWFEGHEYSGLGYQLDKDLLIPNNKIYSSETCCFVPQDLNSLLTSRENDRGEHPQGVDFHRPSGKYRAGIRLNGKKKHLGYFDCPQEAHQVYRIHKERHVKDRALEWQDRIASDVFNALMAWTAKP